MSIKNGIKNNIMRCWQFNNVPFVFPILVCFTLFSCDDSEEILLSQRPSIAEFSLLQKDNPGLERDYVASIVGDSIISLYCPDLQRVDSVIPEFKGNFKSVKVNGIDVISGRTVQDFNNLLHYELIDSVGNRASYKVRITGLNNIPRVDIITEGGVEITSRTSYLPVNISISNCPEFGPLYSKGKIKVRGHGSGAYPKKPYKIKFDEKQGPFNFPANKDWVLLAQACDRSLLRTAYMCEVSKALGIKYTIRYQYVDLFINNIYIGNYLLTDFIERAKNRINIAKEGFIMEDDHYYQQEPLYIKISNIYYTFKYPDAEDGEIIEGDESYNFIYSKLTEMAWELYVMATQDPSSLHYLDIIDVKSFAKWYLLAELTATYDPNIYYVLSSREEKWEMYPMWDAEWSMGLIPSQFTQPEFIISDIIWSKRKYFPYLFKSLFFKKTLEEEWDNFKDNIPAIKTTIDSICTLIQYSQKSNFQVWNSQDFQPTNVSFETWEEEVEYVKNFFDKRIAWLDIFIGSN